MGHVHRAASAVADVARRSAHPRGRLDQTAGFSRRAGVGRQSRAPRPPAPHAADRAGGACCLRLVSCSSQRTSPRRTQRKCRGEHFSKCVKKKFFLLSAFPLSPLWLRLMAEGWQGWDEYADFYDWENAQTLDRRDASFWQDIVERTGGTALELGCGTGRVTLPVARRGARIIGVDRSEEMLAYARRRARRA